MASDSYLAGLGASHGSFSYANRGLDSYQKTTPSDSYLAGLGDSHGLFSYAMEMSI